MTATRNHNEKSCPHCHGGTGYHECHHCGGTGRDNGIGDWTPTRFHGGHDKTRPIKYYLATPTQKLRGQKSIRSKESKTTLKSLIPRSSKKKSKNSNNNHRYTRKNEAVFRKFSLNIQNCTRNQLRFVAMRTQDVFKSYGINLPFEARSVDLLNALITRAATNLPSLKKKNCLHHCIAFIGEYMVRCHKCEWRCLNGSSWAIYSPWLERHFDVFRFFYESHIRRRKRNGKLNLNEFIRLHQNLGQSEHIR